MKLSAEESARLDPEAVARAIVARLLVGEAGDAALWTLPGGAPADFRCLGVSKLVSGTHTVKFRQLFHDVPVFGSLITVELGRRNRPLSFNAALGTPLNVDPVARLAPATALDLAAQAAGFSAPREVDAPQLLVYFDEKVRRWRLSYLVRHVGEPGRSAGAPASAFDVFVDAHFGDLITMVPTAPRLVEDTRDGEGRLRRIVCRESGPGLFWLVNDDLNVWTYDFGFRSVDRDRRRLPGRLVRREGAAPWDPEAVGAHANACEVAGFLLDVLGRRGLDNHGQAIILSIQCAATAGDREWNNAAWVGRQAVFGQRVEGGRLASNAADLDVVAHEIWHGVTVATARLGLSGQSGALHESYADIFAACVANRHEPDVSRWSWEVGVVADHGELRLRDLSQPSRHGQPEHMDDYRDLPLTADSDYGGVHLNSGIHSRTAFLLLSAVDANGERLLDPTTVARLYYLALTEHLSRTSRFANSRLAIEVVARSLLADDSRKPARLQAIADSFEFVGIHLPDVN